MNRLEIGRAGGKPVHMDLEVLLRTRLLIQANSGGGKSYLIRRLAEQAFGKVQVLIVDAEGEFASLRERHGYVLVGKGGETTADPRSAALVAHKLLELRASAVCDIYELKPHARHEWVRRFLEAMVDAPKNLWRPVLVVVDEAHTFCPEKGHGESEASGPMIDLATRGRKRGFAAVYATQRLAKLAKNAAAELLNVLIGPTFIDVDMHRAAEVLGIPRGEEREFAAKMKVLEPGTFYALGRAVAKDRTLFRVGRVETTHPEPGSTKHAAEPPPAPEKVKALLPKLQDLPKAAEEKARTEADLRAEIRSLKAQLAARPTAPAAPPPAAPKTQKLKPVPIKVLRAGELPRLAAMVADAKEAAVALMDAAEAISVTAAELADNERALHARSVEVGRPQSSTSSITRKVNVVQSVDAALEAIQRSGTTPRRDILRDSENAPGPREAGDLDKAQRAILSVLTQHPDGCAAGKLALLAGYRWSGGFRNALASLRSRGLIRGNNGDVMHATPDGAIAMGGLVEPLPTGQALVDYWLRHPSFGAAERKALEVLLQHPGGLTGPQLAEASGYGWSGGFRNALSSLRTAGVVVGRNAELMRVCDELREAIGQ